jgi:hypothetical protein
MHPGSALVHDTIGLSRLRGGADQGGRVTLQAHQDKQGKQVHGAHEVLGFEAGKSVAERVERQGLQQHGGDTHLH